MVPNIFEGEADTHIMIGPSSGDTVDARAISALLLLRCGRHARHRATSGGWLRRPMRLRRPDPEPGDPPVSGTITARSDGTIGHQQPSTMTAGLSQPLSARQAVLGA